MQYLRYVLKINSKNQEENAHIKMELNIQFYHQLFMIKRSLNYFLLGKIVLRGLKYNFCQSKITSSLARDKINTNESKQARGVIAYYFIQYMRQYEFINYLYTKQSIRFSLLNEKLFYQYMLKKVKALNQSVKSLDDLYEILPQRYYRQVASAYQIGSGTPINIEVYRQQRIKNVRNKRFKVALNPICITSFYFNILANGTNHILSGEKGTGKSFSFVGFDYLSSIFLQYRLSLTQKKSQPTNNIQLQVAQFIPKICYVTMEDKLQPSNYFKQILLQYKFILDEAQYKEQWRVFQSKTVTLENLFALLKKINSKCRQYNIKNTIIIDEANRIFRVLRTLKNLKNEEKNQVKIKENTQNNPTQQKWKSSSSFKALQFYNQLIKMFIGDAETQFNSIIFNSSQDFELINIEQTFQSILDDFWIIKFFGKIRIMDGKNKTKYTQFLQLPEGQLQLYNCFWFQIERSIEIKNVKKQTSVPIEQITAKYRATFQEAFEINKLNPQQLQLSFQIPNHFQIWKNQVRHLHIRLYFETVNNQFNNIRQKGKHLMEDFSRFVLDPTSDQLNKFKEECIQVKKAIQSFRKKLILQDIKDYLVKAVEEKQTQQRLQTIKCLQAEVRKTPPASDGQYCYYECKTIPLEKRDGFIERIGFGYNNTANQTLRFSIDQQSFIDIFNELKYTKEYAYLKMDHFLYLLLNKKSKIDNQLYGIMFNNYLYFLFQTQLLLITLKWKQEKQDTLPRYFTNSVIRTEGIRGFTRILTDKQYQQHLKTAKKGQNSSPPQQSTIQNPITVIHTKQTETDHPISESQLKQQFTRLIEKADAQLLKKQYYIAASPMIYLTEDRLNFQPCDNQTIYDNILIKKLQVLQLIFIDWTFGKPSSKGYKQDNPKQIKEKIGNFLKRLKSIIDYKGKVSCTMIVASPQYNLSQQYFADDLLLDQWEVKIRGASFDEDLPFNGQDQLLNQMNLLFKKIYRHSKIVEQKNKQFQKLRTQAVVKK